MKKWLIKQITDSLKKQGINVSQPIEIEVPTQESFGDLATPVAMSLAQQLKKPPRKIAEGIVSAFQDMSMFERIDIAGPGFINFTLSKDYIVSEIRNLLEQKKDYLRVNIGKGRKIQIEFVSANPTGPLHLGHGRGAATGHALSNLLHAAGYDVEREYYINDAGRQVKLLGLSVFARYQHLLGEEYPFPEDGYKGKYISEIAEELIKENGKHYVQISFDDVSEFFINYSYKKILTGIRSDLETFGITFNIWQSERELYESGEVKQAIDTLRSKELIYDQDGATWFKSTAYGDDKDRVIIKNDGEYTYFTSDIAYHAKKIERAFDNLIDIWGADHHGYIQRICAVLEALGYPKEKLRVLLVQMVTLLRGGKPVQMSKREGEFVTLREVINEVGPDITKFIFLTRRPDSHLEFDLDVAKEQSSENPVFYVQYANARINSIFMHAREKNIETEDLDKADLSILTNPDEIRIMKKLLMYTMVFEGAASAYEPHRITFYLQELAGIFHPYYNRQRIITDDLPFTRARLALCRAIGITIKEGLRILGISIPEKM
jgi:arginyl-tRNA synthetase